MITVAIPTFRRPELLRSLLQVLPARLDEARAHGPVEVVVVDNDPEGSAHPVVSEAAFDGLRYVLEPAPGIAAARNAALAAAQGSDVLVFLDDDESPREGWLPALLSTWEQTGAAAVMGRVISVFDHDVDPWVLATGVFRRRPRVTGTVIPAAASGNLLLDVAQVGRRGVTFDQTLGLAGGEDNLFSRLLVARGGTIVWCNESEVEDLVPASRTTRAWAVRRAFNGGNSAVTVALRLEPRWYRRVLVRAAGIVGGIARSSIGWLWHVWGRATGDLRADARGLRTSYRGRGMVAAACGHLHHEYARGA